MDNKAWTTLDEGLSFTPVVPVGAGRSCKTPAAAARDTKGAVDMWGPVCRVAAEHVRIKGDRQLMPIFFAINYNYKKISGNVE